MIGQLVTAFLIVQNVYGFAPIQNRIARTIPTRLAAASESDNVLFSSFRGIVASAIAFGAFGGPVNAADYQSAAAPPSLAPQVAREAPRAAQPGTPQKWIYSKFLDQVEKDQVEKVTFSPDGKRAVGVDNDGDRFTCDIPNDPNLLSFLVQHKVEINVAPINANGGTGSDAAAALVIPESETEKLLQTFVVPGVLTSLIFLYPTFQLLFPSKEQREKNKTKPTGNFLSNLIL
jgi:hypothetical protein